ncbi:MAG: ROK family protein [Bacteroidota bacterium]
MQKLIVGIDIGGTNTKFGLTDFDGNVVFQSKLKTKGNGSFSDYVATLANAIQSGQAECAPEAEIIGVGIGAPNANYYRGTIEHAPNLEWKGVVPLVETIQSHFDVPTIVTNDANAAAVGEMVYGNAKNLKDFIVITLGTGLGSGIVCGGKLVHGHDGFAAEIGHVIVNPNGRLCGCGRRGCLETYVSATGIKRTVYKMLADEMDDSELRGISFHDLSTTKISECADRGDKVAIKAFEYTGQVLGAKLADTVAHTDPETIFLFGGLAQAGELIFEPTRRHLEMNLMPIYRGKVKVLPSGLGNQSAPILGAASLIVDHFNHIS